MQDLHDWKEIIEDIRSEQQLSRLWEKYCEENQYAAGITFNEVVDTVDTIAQLLNF